MSNRTTDTNISLGEYIGRQSNVSLNNISSHLHYEVRSGNSSSLGDGSATLNNLIPYGHMITNANYFSLKRQFVA